MADPTEETPSPPPPGAAPMAAGASPPRDAAAADATRQAASPAPPAPGTAVAASPSPAPPAPGTAVAASSSADAGEHAPSLEETSKKKSRLQWDEDNLISNAQEMERAGPRMKIDEPKTPFVQGSETGSSTSGSAHQSPPESPSFIPGERLVGFRSLEASMRGTGGASSDGASSAGSAGRSVQISDDFAHSSGGSSPRSKELFAARRKAHYRNEAARLSGARGVDSDSEESEDDITGRNDVPNGHQNGHGHTNGGIALSAASQSVRARLALLNEQQEENNAPNGCADEDEDG